MHTQCQKNIDKIVLPLMYSDILCSLCLNAYWPTTSSFSPPTAVFIFVGSAMKWIF